MKRITIKFALRKNVFERLENSDKNQLKSVVNAFWMSNTHSSSSIHNDLKDEFMKFPVVIKCQASTSAKTEILKEFAGLAHGHIQYLGDILALIVYL